MASAQVLPNSRKLGHLEAGKKRLEEFRKKKAEGRAKKSASAVQLQLVDLEQYDKSPPNDEHVTDGATSYRDSGDTSKSSGMVKVHEEKVVSSTKRENISSSNGGNANSSGWVGSNSALHKNLSQEVQKGEFSDLHESSGFYESIYYHNDSWRGVNGELNHKELRASLPEGPATELHDAFNAGHTNADFGGKNHLSGSSMSVEAHLEGNKSSSNFFLNEDTSGAHLMNTQSIKSESVSEQSRLFSSSSNKSAAFEETTPVLEHHMPNSLNHDSLMGDSRRSIADSISRHLNIDRGAWPVPEPAFTDLGPTLRNFSDLHPFGSLGSGTSSGRTRSSFLDSLGLPRVTSNSSTAYSEPVKTNPALQFDRSNFHSTDVLSLPPAELLSREPNTSEHLLKLRSQDVVGEKESAANSSVSLNDGQLGVQEVTGHHLRGHNEFPTMKNDENFTALEQHIEDLTREKFALQRALDTSQALAQSLAGENSSLADSYNQQGKVVSQLKSDLESMQEELKTQLLALESVKSEYTNAQLECNAADERAKILASEVIGLEEKALRLRSNELKLEKQLENMNHEISSYKRKVSILEKERQDFQSAVDLLQEEKKLMLSKLRMVPDGKVTNPKKASPLTKDVSTSTEDLGVGDSNLFHEEPSLSEYSTMNALGPSTVDASTSFLPDNRGLYMPDGSGGIPHDQLRMVDNINALISELALEKEELMRALKTESSNNSKLKDLNNDLSQKLEVQTQRLELLTAQRIASENVQAKPIDTHSMPVSVEYADEGDEVVERVLNWILKLFPGGPAKRRPSKLL